MIILWVNPSGILKIVLGKQWIIHYVEGHVKMCCLNTGAEPFGNLFENSIDEIRLMDDYQNVKKGCNTNNPTDHCKNCSYKELTPILSHGDIMKKHLKNIIRKFDTEDKSKYDYVLNQSERIKELEFFDWNRFKQSLTQEDFSISKYI